MMFGEALHPLLSRPRRMVMCGVAHHPLKRQPPNGVRSRYRLMIAKVEVVTTAHCWGLLLGPRSCRLWTSSTR